ncbi:MAG: ABC transporter ATP-binding protein/permease [Alphaproteobacteria bacterium]|nr:ABC transporter ATP-binding protein/permease [Alphaproteobacteria bacterium]
MKDVINYKHYGKCIKDILISTLEDKKIRLNFFFSLIGLSIGIISNLSIPFLLKNIVESLSSQSSLSITLVLLSYGLIWMLSQGSLHVRALLTYKIEQRITFVLGIKVLSHLYSLSHSYFLNQKSGALTNVIRKSQQNVPSIVFGVFFHVLPTVLEFFFVIILISSLYPFFYSLLMIGIVGAFFLYTSLSMRRTLKYREKANEVDKCVDGIITDWLSNYEAIKVFGKCELAVQTCKKELKKREVAEVTFMTKYSLSRLWQSLILGIGLSSLTYFIGQDVLQGSLTVGDFILFNGYVVQFIIPVGILGQVTQDIRKALIDMKGILNILLTKSDIVELSHPIVLSDHRFQINFENVSFKYKDRNILENISFKIEAGETALIVGQTGIGKSTIAKLLLRLYDPTEGHVFINKTNIKQFSLESLYNTIGWVPQESYLLNDTIKNNIHFVCPEATLIDIEEALDRAHLLSFIKNLPQGLNTIVGDRGLKLSGGEKQRLSLARLFLKKPKICIFDESTSSLDKDTDFIIQNNIEKFLPHATKIIITHRPYLAHKVDQIITLEKQGVKSSINQPTNKLWLTN